MAEGRYWLVETDLGLCQLDMIVTPGPLVPCHDSHGDVDVYDDNNDDKARKHSEHSNIQEDRQEIPKSGSKLIFVMYG